MAVGQRGGVGATARRESKMRCEDLGASSDGRLTSPSAGRNRGNIADVLAEVMPSAGVVLEIASGTGQHVIHFARAMPALTWQPSECNEDCLRSISAWLASEPLPNLRPPLRLDVNDATWPIARADAIVCVNMIHIAPWSATRALMRGASTTLAARGLLYLYGPYRLQGRHTSASNQAFDQQLWGAHRAWGVRDLDAVVNEARAVGLHLLHTVEMPANNLSVVFKAT